MDGALWINNNNNAIILGNVSNFTTLNITSLNFLHFLIEKCLYTKLKY